MSTQTLEFETMPRVERQRGIDDLSFVEGSQEERASTEFLRKIERQRATDRNELLRRFFSATSI